MYVVQCACGSGDHPGPPCLPRPLAPPVRGGVQAWRCALALLLNHQSVWHSPLNESKGISIATAVGNAVWRVRIAPDLEAPKPVPQQTSRACDR